MSDTPGFYIDPRFQGMIRGGFFDEMGGILVGAKAQWVCDALNLKLKQEQASPPIKGSNG